MIAPAQTHQRKLFQPSQGESLANWQDRLQHMDTAALSAQEWLTRGFLLMAICQAIREQEQAQVRAERGTGEERVWIGLKAGNE